MVFDLKDYLFMALILKEQDFRESMKTHDWSQYKDKVLCVFCSTDAIIPSWGYMLVATMAAPYAKEVFFGTPDQWISRQLMHLYRTTGPDSLYRSACDHQRMQ